MAKNRRAKLTPKDLAARFDTLQQEYPGKYQLGRVIRWDAENEPVLELEGALQSLEACEQGEYLLTSCENGEIVAKASVGHDGERDDRYYGSRGAVMSERDRAQQQLNEGWERQNISYQQSYREERDENKRLRKEIDELKDKLREVEAGGELKELAELGQMALAAWQERRFRAQAIELLNKVLTRLDDRDLAEQFGAIFLQELAKQEGIGVKELTS
jgi:hypothetical protein